MFFIGKNGIKQKGRHYSKSRLFSINNMIKGNIFVLPKNKPDEEFFDVKKLDRKLHTLVWSSFLSTRKSYGFSVPRNS